MAHEAIRFIRQTTVVTKNRFNSEDLSPIDPLRMRKSPSGTDRITKIKIAIRMAIENKP